MNILFIGDVVGQKSCANLREKLPFLKREYNIDTVIANGENSADGNGITPVTAKYLLDSGSIVLQQETIASEERKWMPSTKHRT